MFHSYLMPVLHSQTLYATSYLFHHTVLIDLVSLLSIWQKYSLDFFQVSLIGRSNQVSLVHFTSASTTLPIIHKPYCAKQERIYDPCAKW